ncbi:hypothetical protein QYE76_046264 [Lolium multiflorum]|uniref:Uncharacterized protein n=1 Tax=Lolium multiflorum TaxID=4521 RepID=A0AAD8TN22_LOLMU|nr:hypothetical protein QYE76_046264 [Lolium multiflorum]
MVRNNMTLIRCPCRKCGLRQWIDPDSGQLEEHLLRRGFMLGFDEEPAANVGHEEEADIGREDEESPEHGVHHEEGEADEGDDDAGGDGGGDAERKQTPLTSALRDPHVQELLLKDTGNAKPEAKLAQMEVDGMTPLYPGCRPEDTRLSVTLECLEMKAEHKWTDSSFSDNMKSWHARLPKDNTFRRIDEAKKVNHGFKGCVKCMDKTPHLQLPKPPGSCKTVFQGTRMWLRFDHPWRKRKDLFNGEEELGRAPRPRSGEEISELLENWEECPARERSDRGNRRCWEYGKREPTWHSMNMPERTKDGPKARTDLKLLGLKKELQYHDMMMMMNGKTTQGHHKRAKKNEVVVLKPAASL